MHFDPNIKGRDIWFFEKIPVISPNIMQKTEARLVVIRITGTLLQFWLSINIRINIQIIIERKVARLLPKKISPGFAGDNNRTSSVRFSFSSAIIIAGIRIPAIITSVERPNIRPEPFGI
jgi:hypothetical protein